LGLHIFTSNPRNLDGTMSVPNFYRTLTQFPHTKKKKIRMPDLLNFIFGISKKQMNILYDQFKYLIIPMEM
jgi:hypothetical protein